MLKMFLASLALTVGIIHPSIASDITKLPTELVCANEKDIADVLDKFEEIPFATMIAMREMSRTGITENSMVIFVNPKTKSFTIVERFSKNVYCIVALGENIKPYRDEK